jgi:putative FmdB family regulatory protein
MLGSARSAVKPCHRCVGVLTGGVPIYEYECKKCKRHFEYLEKMSDRPRKKCERCGGALERKISPAGFVLKGTGWYKTDYAQKPSGGDDKPASEKSESKPKPSDKKD